MSRITTSCSILLAAFAVGLTVNQANATFTETFSNPPNTEGWIAQLDSQSNPGTSGNPGGYLRGSNTLAAFPWIAPSAGASGGNFEGNIWTKHGNSLTFSFDVAMLSPVTQTNSMRLFFYQAGEYPNYWQYNWSGLSLDQSDGWSHLNVPVNRNWSDATYLANGWTKVGNPSSFVNVLANLGSNYDIQATPGSFVSGGTNIVGFDNIGWNAIPTPPQTLDRGHQILLDRGLQIQAVAIPAGRSLAVSGVSDYDRWLSSNFTTLNSWWYPNTDALAALPAGQQWSRAWTGVQGPGSASPELLTSAEMPYVEAFTSMQLFDEPSSEMLTDTSHWLPFMRDTYREWNQLYPNTIAYSNFGSNVTESVLANYMQFTQPDMLAFDAYPARASDREHWYSSMQMYRKAALAGNDGTGQHPIPFGQFLWLSRVGYSYDSNLPSESLVRLNQFANWAFGGTWASGWVYTSTAQDISAVFSSDGDNSPTPVFSYVAETNRQSRNLGPALVSMLSSDVRMIRGRNVLTFNSLPNGILEWSRGTADTAGYNDYLFSIQPTVSQGGAADTTYSDILIGYFKPLLADNSAITFVDGLHFMIVNGSMTGTAAQSAQWYRITFDFTGSDFNSLVRLSRDTGLVELVTLVHGAGSIYYFDLNLPGGTGDLFGFWNSSDPLPRITPLPGDFDSDGDVDGADFVVWQTNFPKATGGTLATGDADGDGDVDGADFVVWQTSFPFSSSSASASSIPEPPSVVIFCLCSLALVASNWCSILKASQAGSVL